MIHVNRKDITGIFQNNHTIEAVYYGARLVWQWFKSCFGAGYWRPKKPWLYNESWTYKTKKPYVDLPSIETQWKGYTDRAIEKAIKDNFNKKVGWVHLRPSTEEDCGYLYGFKDEAEYQRWAGGDTSVVPIFRIIMPYL